MLKTSISSCEVFDYYTGHCIARVVLFLSASPTHQMAGSSLIGLAVGSLNPPKGGLAARLRAIGAERRCRSPYTLLTHTLTFQEWFAGRRNSFRILAAEVGFEPT